MNNALKCRGVAALDEGGLGGVVEPGGERHSQPVRRTNSGAPMNRKHRDKCNIPDRDFDGQPIGTGQLVRVYLPLVLAQEHTSELQSPYVISYAVFCLKKKI